MSIRTAYSTKPLTEAVAELAGALRDGAEPKVVFFFASPVYDSPAISREMQSAFPQACVLGCSTAGEIAGGHMLTGSVVAMSLDGDVVEDAAVAVVPNLAGGVDLAGPFGGLEGHFHAPAASWDIEKYVGLALTDGLSGAEERLAERLGDLTDVSFVGGSAGDDLKFERTHVCAAGQALTGSAVLLVMKLRRGFEILKTQSFRLLGKSLVATAVDEPNRTVIEFNSRPALEAYAEALGVPPAEAAAAFFEHPLGLMVDGEPFVRSPQRASGGKVVFYCQIKEGTELQLLCAADVVADTRKFVEARKAGPTPIQGVIDFHCILRTLQLRHENRCDEYGAIFADVPMIGFSTYGEMYVGHLNQTSTILLLH